MHAQRVEHLRQFDPSPPRRKPKLDVLILALLLANAFVIRYTRTAYGFPPILTPASIDLCAGIYGAAMLVREKQMRSLAIFGGATLLLWGALIANISATGTSGAAFGNAVSIYSPLLSAPFWIHLIDVRRTDPQHILESLRRALNAFFYINATLIAVQIQTQTFLLSPFLGINSYAPDHIDGLLGLNGVTILNYVWLATLTANILYHQSRTSILAKLNVCTQLALIIWMSSENDNKMLYPTLIASFLCCAYLIGLVRNPKFANGVVAAIAAAAAVALTAGGPKLRSLVTENETIKIFWYSPGNPPNYNNERALFNYLAYRDYGAASNGMGLGFASPYSNTINTHLGINSASLLLIQGGIPLLIITIAAYSIVTAHLISLASSLKLQQALIPSCALVAVTSYASQLFRDHYLSTAFFLFVFIVAMSIAAIRSLAPEPQGIPTRHRVELNPRS